jgi:hypothetical protein
MRDILALESDVARTIAREIRAKVTDPEQARMTGKQAVNPQAHEAYLRGIYSDDMMKAVGYFDRANQLDPDYAPPYAAAGGVFQDAGRSAHGPQERRQFGRCSRCLSAYQGAL